MTKSMTKTCRRAGGRFLGLAGAGLLLALLGACGQEGPAEQAGKKIDATVNAAKDSAAKAAGDAKQAVSETAEKVKDAAADAAESAKNAASDAADKTKEAAEEASEKVKEKM
jgi:F0F1-type ATP synthase membrane subunit b/b'